MSNPVVLQHQHITHLQQGLLPLVQTRVRKYSWFKAMVCGKNLVETPRSMWQGLNHVLNVRPKTFSSLSREMLTFSRLIQHNRISWPGSFNSMRSCDYNTCGFDKYLYAFYGYAMYKCRKATQNVWCCLWRDILSCWSTCSAWWWKKTCLKRR